MSWSTSRLASIAGTTVKTIRYYHQVGVLADPERTSNGYKQYQVEHLIDLLRILRLKELGISAHDSSGVTDSGADPWEALRILDAELEQRITKWTAVRAELATVLRQPRRARPIVDLPAGMLGLADEVSDADRAMLLVYSQLFDQETMEAIAESMRNHKKTAAEVEFDSLPADTDPATRRRLAEQLAPIFTASNTTSGSNVVAPVGIAKDAGTVEETIAQALAKYYNPAQLDVLQQLSVLNRPTEDREPLR